MKRVLQVVMVALVLGLGAERASASTIAYFVWTDDYFSDAVFFDFNNIGTGNVTNLRVVINQPTPEFVATMSPPFIGPQILLDPDGVFTFLPGDIGRLTVSFDYDGAPVTPQSLLSTDLLDFGDRFEAQLNFDEPVLVPEPASMTLLGLGIAGAAIVRRRRQ